MFHVLNPEKNSCILCGKESVLVSKNLSVCVDCIRKKPEDALKHGMKAHTQSRKQYGLPETPPKKGKVHCNLCANECHMREGESSYCGLKRNTNGKLESLVSPEKALAHAYYDPLPTNCCAAWFCPESRERGCNLAFFFYGCSFNCLFCQNSSHKEIPSAGSITAEDFLKQTLNPKVRCVCFFGGSPEPQLPFALSASKRILEEKKLRICWEWNGSGNPDLVRKATELSLASSGIIKFDLKAFDENLSFALSGVSNKRTLENFALVAGEYFEGTNPPLLTATTLLVPGYVDETEVGKIASFITSLNREIPYSLLVFHPDFMMRDLPVTPKKQVEECFTAAKKHLKNVTVGNKHLLTWS